MSQNYEINFGENTYFITHAGNVYCACLQAFEQFLESDPDTIPISVFHTTNLSNGYGTEQIVGLADILSIKHLSAQFDEEKELVGV